MFTRDPNPHPRPLTAPAPATSTRESRPTTFRHTPQSARNKESRTLGLEAIGKLCRHGRKVFKTVSLLWFYC